ncbi:MAG: ATP-binding protein [Pyrinomonadaceae bacterium]
MTTKIILAHAEDEESLAEILEEALGKAGYEVVHRGTVFVGDSYSIEFRKYLDQRLPIIVCGTINAIGTGWVRHIVSAAQTSGIRIFPIKLELRADLNSIITNDLKVIDCSGTNFDRGIRQLIRSIEEYYPPDSRHVITEKEEVLKPFSYLDRLTSETKYSKDILATYRARLRVEIRDRYPDLLPDHLFLEKMNLLVGNKLTLTGVLLFTENLNRYSPSAVAKCSVYSGVVVSAKTAKNKVDFEGPIQHQIEQSYNFILTNIDKKEQRKSDQIALEVLYQYPVECLRETVANAFCHRDYADGSQTIHINVFSDRIEIGSPGSWYGQELTDGQEYLLDELKPASKLRNPTLAKAIFAIKSFEGRGQGIPFSIEDCLQNNAPIPIVVEREGYVTVIVFPRGDWTEIISTLTKVSIGRIPVTGPDLFGREQELKILDEAWSDPATNILSLVAWGGVGKSALVNHWLGRMARDNYRGATQVYGWSFYSQGTSDRAVSADQFIEAALTWFGDPYPNRGSPWEKGERLAHLVGAQRALLVLDGVESLQYPPGPNEGRFKDQALQALVRQLAAYNKGLCIISTRITVADLSTFEGGTVKRINLETLSPEAGVQVLAAQGVKGAQGELEQASREFGGHPLALNLLGNYLSDVYGGDISRRTEVRGLEEDERHGRHAQRVMASYERWFGDGPELAVLRMLGLFNRPADHAAIDALRAAPAIPDLTDTLQGLSEQKWQQVLARLRRAKLLAAPGNNQPATLDTHPLVREHFGQQLKHTHIAAWREGNNRLYEHLRDTTKEFPDTLEEMAPLYTAIAHGCAAGRHQEALDEVFQQRIRRGNAAFSIRNLGAYGADLTALSGFFDLPWQQPVSGLTETNKGYVLSEAGFVLRALGQLKESSQPMQAGLEADILLNNWKNAAILASNLSETYLTIGDLSQALVYAQRSVEFADQSRDSFKQMSDRATLANTFHQAGHLSEAEYAFREIEKMQKDRQPEFPILYSLHGFRYCDLLLDQGKYLEVQDRAELTLTWVMSRGWLLDIALDYLSIGRAYLLKAQQEATGYLAEATDYLKRAVGGLRQAGRLDFLPSGLLARAELYRVKDEFERAQGDLDEALRIATRGSMGLHEADCHLEYARLHVARKEWAQARASWARAQEMIERMGYGRRDRDVREIDEQLTAAGV